MNEKTLKVVFFITILVFAFGVGGAISFLWRIFSIVLDSILEANFIIYQTIGKSLLSGLFKHFLTYKIVGLILATGITGGSLYLSKVIGKLAYVIIGIGITMILNFITILVV